MNDMRRIRVAASAMAWLIATAPSAYAQACLPFAPGERLIYAVRAATMGARGEASFTSESMAV